MFFYQLETRHANGDLMLRDALPSPRQFSYEIRIVLTVRCFEQPEIHSEKQLFRQKKKKKKKRHLHLVLRCTLLSVACGCVECVASRRFSSIGHLASYWWNQSILSPLSGHVTWVTRCSVLIAFLLASLFDFSFKKSKRTNERRSKRANKQKSKQTKLNKLNKKQNNNSNNNNNNNNNKAPNKANVAYVTESFRNGSDHVLLLCYLHFCLLLFHFQFCADDKLT